MKNQNLIKDIMNTQSVPPQQRKKFLCYSDSVQCATGFAQVARNILMGVHNSGRYNVIQLGINYWGDPHEYPFPIYPMGVNKQNDPYGREKAKSMILNLEWDVLFLLQDTFILQFLRELVPEIRRAGKKGPIVVYAPADGIPRPEWIEGISHADVCIAYTDWAKKEWIKAFAPIESKVVDVLPHGINTKHFFPMPEEEMQEFRRNYFGKVAGNFIFCNVNRNQQRKDIPRTLMAFKKVLEARPNLTLYLHMASKDLGWDLAQVVRSLDLDLNTDVLFPANFNVNQGFPLDILNRVYNSVDCMVSTTLGEGWGLSWLEAMAVNRPVIFPDNTALTENLADGRGLLVKSGEDWDHHTVICNDFEVVRPVTNLDDLVEKMIYCIDNPEEMKEMSNKAYKWVLKNLNWDDVVSRFIKVFDNSLNIEREEPAKVDVL